MTNISVLIPADDYRADGFIIADPPQVVDLDYTDLELPSEFPSDTPVRRVPVEALQAFIRQKGFGRFEKRYGELNDERRARILGLFVLVEHIRTETPATMERYLGYVRAWLSRSHSGQKWQPTARQMQPITDLLYNHEKSAVQENPLRLLAGYLDRQGALKLWWNTAANSLDVGIVAGGFFQSLLVHLLLNYLNPESAAICARCQSEFVRTKTTQVFCSLRCGNAARKAKQRKIQGEESNHGTR